MKTHIIEMKCSQDKTGYRSLEIQFAKSLLNLKDFNGTVWLILLQTCLHENKEKTSTIIRQVFQDYSEFFTETHFEFDHFINHHEISEEDLNQFCVAYHNTFPHSLNSPTELRQTIQEILEEGSKEYPNQGELIERLNFLIECLGLNPVDRQIIQFYYLKSANPQIESLVEQKSILEIPDFLSTLFGCSIHEVQTSLKQNSILIQNELLEFNYKGWEISDTLNQFILGLESIDEILNGVTLDSDPTFPLSSFSPTSLDKQIIQNLIQSNEPFHVLIYGPPGTGKTEFVRAIAQSMNQKLVVIGINEEGDEFRKKGSRLRRKFMLHYAIRQERFKDCLFLFDEADELFQKKDIYSQFFFGGFRDTKVDKLWGIEFLEKSNSKVFFIMNEGDQIVEPLKRRFDCILQFTEATAKDRELFWNYKVKGNSLEKVLSQEDIKALSFKYPLDAGGISQCLKTFEKIIQPEEFHQKQKLQEKLNYLLTNHTIQVKNTSPKKVSFKNKYNPDLLNTDFELNTLIEILQEANDSLYHPDTSHSLCLLFYGIPGTGKTEFVHYLGKILNREIIHKRASDLFSKWVGDTEKNISSAFQEASQKKSILFFDEADSFLQDRIHLQNRFEVSSVNEVLTQMEGFPGIFIASTNLIDQLDRAALRRFSFKIRFHPLTREGKSSLFRIYFSELLKDSIEDKLIQDLQEIQDLTPGDFASVRNRMVYRKFHPNLQWEILSNLRQEVELKTRDRKNQIGF
jgi:transitional endoplasmic reticulum ATPase